MNNALKAVSRRDVLRTAAVCGGALGLNFVGHAQPGLATLPPARSETGAEFINNDTQAAIDRGLASLAQLQESDGSFSDRNTGSSAGVTGIAGLAIMSAGNQPGR